MVRISARVSEVNVIKEAFGDVSKKVKAALIKSFPNSKWEVQLNESSVVDDDGIGHESIRVECFELSGIKEAKDCDVVLKKALTYEYGKNAHVWAAIE